jgi:biopolymer transport protein TolQ
MLTTLSSLSLPAGAAPGLLLAAAGGSFNLWATFLNAEIFGQIIVVLLMFFSLLAWTVMIGKHMELTTWRRVNQDFQGRLRDTETLMRQTVSDGLRQSVPYARLFHDAIEAARQHAAARDATIRMGLIENALQRGVGTECVRYERKMVLLGSLVSGAPFMGLLGTVVGVMVAFNAMAQSTGSTLQNIGPGVASALLATVCGLLVAIPSVFGYNFLLSQTKIMITELENFASWLADRMELELEAQKIVPFQSQPSTQPIASPASAASAYHPPAPAPRPSIPAPKPAAEPIPPVAERYLRFDVSEDE